MVAGPQHALTPPTPLPVAAKEVWRKFFPTPPQPTICLSMRVKNPWLRSGCGVAAEWPRSGRGVAAEFKLSVAPRRARIVCPAFAFAPPLQIMGLPGLPGLPALRNDNIFEEPTALICTYSTELGYVNTIIGTGGAISISTCNQQVVQYPSSQSYAMAWSVSK